MVRFFSPMPIVMTVLTAAALLASPAQAQSVAPFQKISTDRYQFTKIRINHYDAGMIAYLITRPDGIIVVPPNFVVPVGTTAPQKAAPSAAPNTTLSTASTVLPEGVRRIFVLESDNSLVIEATPEGLASLTFALSL